MIHLQQATYEMCISAVSASAGGTVTSQTIDTIVNNSKAHYLTIPVWSTTADVVSDCPSVLKLQEADVTNTSSFADIVAFVGGTATSATVGFVIPNDVTASTQQVKYVFNVNLLGRKRYLRMLVSPQTSQTFIATAILSREAIAPSSLASANVNQLLVTG